MSTLSNPNVTMFTSGGPSQLSLYDELVASPFNTVVIFSTYILDNGDIVLRNFGTDQTGVLAGSSGVFNPTGNKDIELFRQKILNLKRPGSTINRVELCFGVGSYWDNGNLITDPTWQRIKKIYDQRTINPGPSANLMKNVIACCTSLNLDAICNDDEVQFDADSSLWFARISGLPSTICPAGEFPYWLTLVTRANTNQPNPLIDVLYLQAWTAWDGWDGKWPFKISPNAGVFIAKDYPDSLITPPQAEVILKSWQSQVPLAGGWYYNAADIMTFRPKTGSYADYAKAVLNAIPKK